MEIVVPEPTSARWLANWPYKDKKPCRICLVVKPLDEFPNYYRGFLGRFAYCIPCKATVDRRNSLVKKYGKDVLELDDRIQAGEPCESCHRRPSAHIDHCHKTEKLRGILCLQCNTALGLLGDEPENVRLLLGYIERADVRGTPPTSN